MADGLEKVINLIKKTGDRCIILDHHGEPAYVVMSFQQYERLHNGSAGVAGLTEDQLLNTINQQVATWRADQAELNDQNWEAVKDVLRANQSARGQKKSPEKSENQIKSLNQAENEPIGDQYDFEPIE